MKELKANLISNFMRLCIMMHFVRWEFVVIGDAVTCGRQDNIISGVDCLLRNLSLERLALYARQRART